MNKQKLIIIFPLVFSLVLAGYFLVQDYRVKAQEQEDEDVTVAEEVEEEEVEEAGNKFENLFKRLEKAELRLDKAPMSLIITSQKKATLVNVVLDTIEGTNLKVKIFGLIFTVDASEATTVGGGKELVLSDLKVGDRLLIKGVVNAETGVIEANRIHDRTLHKTAISNLKVRIQELLQIIERLQERLRIHQE